jgi:hypothetical protein
MPQRKDEQIAELATARAAQEEVATRNWVEWKKAERRIAELEGALRIAQKHVPKAYQARHEAGQPPPEWNTEDRRIVDAALAGTGVASDEARTASSPEVSEAMIEAGARWFAGLRDGEGIVSAHRYVETEPSDTDRAYARAVLTAALRLDDPERRTLYECEACGEWRPYPSYCTRPGCVRKSQPRTPVVYTPVGVPPPGL